jgi:hypothetical protein
MTDEVTKEWSGVLAKQRLFVGSKSESDYWVLLTRDSRWFRLAGINSELIADWLDEHAGCNVTLVAKLDTFRGHRRLILNKSGWFVTQDSPPTGDHEKGDSDVL